jgi:hypothetical protein
VFVWVFVCVLAVRTRWSMVVDLRCMVCAQIVSGLVRLRGCRARLAPDLARLRGCRARPGCVTLPIGCCSESISIDCIGHQCEINVVHSLSKFCSLVRACALVLVRRMSGRVWRIGTFCSGTDVPSIVCKNLASAFAQLLGMRGPRFEQTLACELSPWKRDWTSLSECMFLIIVVTWKIINSHCTATLRPPSIQSSLCYQYEQHSRSDLELVVLSCLCEHT